MQTWVLSRRKKWVLSMEETMVAKVIWVYVHFETSPLSRIRSQGFVCHIAKKKGIKGTCTCTGHISIISDPKGSTEGTYGGAIFVYCIKVPFYDFNVICHMLHVCSN